MTTFRRRLSDLLGLTVPESEPRTVVSPWSPAWPMSLALVALAWTACVLVMWEVTPL